MELQKYNNSHILARKQPKTSVSNILFLLLHNNLHLNVFLTIYGNDGRRNC